MELLRVRRRLAAADIECLWVGRDYRRRGTWDEVPATTMWFQAVSEEGRRLWREGIVVAIRVSGPVLGGLGLWLGSANFVLDRGWHGRSEPFD